MRRIEHGVYPATPSLSLRRYAIAAAVRNESASILKLQRNDIAIFRSKFTRYD